MSQVSGLDNGPPLGDYRHLANPPGDTPVAAAPYGVIHQRQVRNSTSSQNVYKELYSESHAAKVWRVAQEFLAREVSYLPVIRT